MSWPLWILLQWWTLGTLTLDFWPPDCESINFCCLSTLLAPPLVYGPLSSSLHGLMYQCILSQLPAWTNTAGNAPLASSAEHSPCPNRSCSTPTPWPNMIYRASLLASKGTNHSVRGLLWSSPWDQAEAGLQWSPHSHLAPPLTCSLLTPSALILRALPQQTPWTMSCLRPCLWAVWFKTLSIWVRLSAWPEVLPASPSPSQHRDTSLSPPRHPFSLKSHGFWQLGL